jgi:hypothetical protein
MKNISLMVSQEQTLKERQQENYLKQSEQERELRQFMQQQQNKKVQVTSTYH